MYDPQGDYQNGYNYGKNGGSWRNDMNSHETSGYNAAKQQEEARRFQQIQQQETQRRQQEEARRTQQQFIDQQAAQQRQQQAAGNNPFSLQREPLTLGPPTWAAGADPHARLS